ncbi:uncharacterized protein LOC134764351 [Penaeus indicus]|uniref:uncharacterized protein LOC134764351 n=1 Tax=Penaeus indicus TaxID=29960 RepID=UPI00300D7A08
MKTLIAVLLVVFVAAEQKREAEPSYGLHYPLPYPYGVGLGSAYGLYPYGSHSFLSTRSHVLHKRDAEADPGYLLGGGLGLGSPYGYGYTNIIFNTILNALEVSCNYIAILINVPSSALGDSAIDAKFCAFLSDTPSTLSL